jgi:glycosyltransferase involved in cell wall biosynthesis
MPVMMILLSVENQGGPAAGLPAARMAMIPNHLDNGNIPANPQKAPSQTVIYLARYSEEKQHALLLNAFRKSDGDLMRSCTLGSGRCGAA